MFKRLFTHSSSSLLYPNLKLAKGAAESAEPLRRPVAEPPKGADSASVSTPAGGDVVSVYKSAKGLIPEKNIPAEFFAREYLLDYTLSMMRATR